jgi:hypothetical protein
MGFYSGGSICSRTLVKWYYFKAEAGRLHHHGLLLHRLVRVMYGIFIALYLLDQLRYRNDGLERIEPIIISQTLLSLLRSLEKNS